MFGEFKIYGIKDNFGDTFAAKNKEEAFSLVCESMNISAIDDIVELSKEDLNARDFVFKNFESVSMLALLEYLNDEGLLKSGQFSYADFDHNDVD